MLILALVKIYHTTRSTVGCAEVYSVSAEEILELRERIIRLEARVEMLEKRVESISNYLKQLYEYIQSALTS